MTNFNFFYDIGVKDKNTTQWPEPDNKKWSPNSSWPTLLNF